MIGILGAIAQPALFALNPEQAHKLTITALQRMPSSLANWQSYPNLQTHVAGLDFPNPLGMAAGFDKNAQVPDALLNIGFGFTEAGTITPKPQAGNPKPRVFRLYSERSLINRLGFNNEGHEAALARLNGRKKSDLGLVGVNVGANKDSEDRILDYVQGIERFYKVCDYFTVNISSPNTPGLRALQHGDELKRLLDGVAQARSDAMLEGNAYRPIFLKLAPDLETQALDDLIEIVNASELDGVIMSNTTLSRSEVQASKLKAEAGGLSGRAVYHRSTVMLARTRQRLAPRMALIGVGGVYSAGTALDKIRAGADLVQLYSGLVFEGVGVVKRILDDLEFAVQERGFQNIADFKGQKTDWWAKQPV